MSNAALDEANRLQGEIDSVLESLRTVKSEEPSSKLQAAYDKAQVELTKATEKANKARQAFCDDSNAKRAALGKVNGDLQSRFEVLKAMQQKALKIAQPYSTGGNDILDARSYQEALRNSAAMYGKPSSLF